MVFYLFSFFCTAVGIKKRLVMRVVPCFDKSEGGRKFLFLTLMNGE